MSARAGHEAQNLGGGGEMLIQVQRVVAYPQVC